MRYLTAMILSAIFSFTTLGAWRVVPSGVADHLNGLCLLDDQNVYAVGNNGVILHYEGADWHSMPSGTENSLEDIDMLDDSEGWIVGNQGVILHYLDGKWQMMEEIDPQLNFKSVKAFASDDVVFAGYGLLPGGVILHWNGATLEEVFSAKFNFVDIAASGPSDIWVIGADGALLHYDGDQWRVIDAPFDEEVKLFGITLDEDKSPVVCAMRMPDWAKGRIYKLFNNSTWSMVYDEYVAWLLDIDIYETVGFSLGKRGFTVEQDVFGWSQRPAVTGEEIAAVKLFDMSRGWAVGTNGLILRYERPAIDLAVSPETVYEGDEFSLKATYENPTSENADVSVFIFLEAYGYFYFWPAWTQDVDFQDMELAPNSSTTETILQFQWPETSAIGKATFWGAFVSGSDLLNYDTETFQWN